MMTPDEYQLATQVGGHRLALALARKAVGTNGQPQHDWGALLLAHVNGAASEMALCKWGGVWWTGLEGIGAPDTALGEVRHTEHTTGGLLLTPEDRGKPDARYFLLRGRAPHFSVVGWAWGRDVMQPRYWRADLPRPAWLMPATDLRTERP